MKPRPFDYIRPESADEAVALLAVHGENARVLAGGQSLMAMLNLRLAEPEALIDACRTPERWRPLREAARRTVIDRYDRRRHCLPTWLALLTYLADAPARA